MSFNRIGHTVEVQATEGQVRFYHRGQTVAEHPRLAGQHQLCILPEHGPEAIARNTRHGYGLAGRTTDPVSYSRSASAALGEMLGEGADVAPDLVTQH